jgi:hypothetical protein
VALKPIGAQNCAFLKFELEHGDSRRRKTALQTLSKLYRTQHVLNVEQRQSFELAVNGLVLQANQDRKVARWCLNVLAHVGQRGNSDRYITQALKLYEGDPEIMAAGIAALSKMYGSKIGENPNFLLFDPTLRTLAAMQHTDAKHLDLGKIRINLDHSSPEVLKLALITVGLNKEVENLFHPRHGNGQIVKALGQYPDPIVVQYSVWAIIENKRLAMKDLGIKLDRIDTLPSNIQSKVLQLIVERETDSHKKHRYVADGPYYDFVEAREGLARGLSSKYYDGLEEVTIDWFASEAAPEIRGLLAEHFARFSEVCSPYEEKAFEIVSTESRLKEQILAGAEGKRLYRKIREQDAIAEMPDLFSDHSVKNVGVILEARKLFKTTELKVLFMAAVPLNTSSLRVDQEARDMKEKLKLVDNPKSTVLVNHEWAVRLDQLQDILQNQKPAVLHFSGHGGGNAICFEDPAGNAADLSAEDFADLLELAGNSIECVVLNACFSSMVASKIKAPVKCVVGCDDSIADDAAIVFSKAFYRALAHGRSYENSFRLARNDVSIQVNSSEADKYKFHSN